MAASKRKIGIYSIAGIGIASIIIVSILVSGLSPLAGPSNNKAVGTLSISVKDAPVELQKLDLTITAIYVQNAEEDSWKSMPLIDDQSEVSFDLLALRDISMEISATQLPVGNYTKVRLEVSSAIATYPDDSTQDLKVPPGHIDIIAKFTISENQETKLLIDIQPDTMAISHSGNFRPVIKTTITSDGPVTSPTPTATSTSTA